MGEITMDGTDSEKLRSIFRRLKSELPVTENNISNSILLNADCGALPFIVSMFTHVCRIRSHFITYIYVVNNDTY